MRVSECVWSQHMIVFYMYTYIHTTHIVLIDFSFSVIRDLISSIPFHSIPFTFSLFYLFFYCC